MEPSALSQRQLDALYRLLVPRGVDPEDERTLLKLAVSMSTQLDQNRRGPSSSSTSISAVSRSSDAARQMASKSLTQCLFACNTESNLSKTILPQLEILMAFHIDSSSNDEFFTYCLNTLKQTKAMHTHSRALSGEELSVVTSVLIAAGNVSAGTLSASIKSSWDRVMFDILQSNIPSTDAELLRVAHFLESVELADEKYSPEFFNFLHLVFHVANHMKLGDAGWIPNLCKAISMFRDGFSGKPQAVAIMTQICGSQQTQSMTYHSFLFAKHIAYIQQLTGVEEMDFSFSKQIQLHSTLSSLIRIASNNLPLWHEYISEHPEVFSYLLEGSVADFQKSSSLLLRLVALCGGHCSTKLNDVMIEQLLDTLLYAPERKTREDASFVLQNIDDSTLIPLLSKRLFRMPSAGVRSEQFAMLWANTVKDKSDSNQMVTDSITQFINLCRYTDTSLSRHPNAHIYDGISRYLNLTDCGQSIPGQQSNSTNSSGVTEKFGYYLEPEPCSVCCDRFGDFELFKVRDVESESKFTHCTRIIRLQEMKSIRSVNIRLEDVSNIRSIKTVRLYFNSEKVDSLASLKDKWDRWTLAKSMRVAPWSNEIALTTCTDFCAFNLLIEFVDFYESMDGSLEIVQCPRCRSPVTSRHGICSQCKENAFQCRQCRNINYEHLDGFLCNECGFCRFAQLQISVSARPSFTVATIRNEKDRRHLVEKILCAHAVELQASLDDTVSHRTDILSLLSADSVSQGRLARVYREARATFRCICSNYAIVVAARRELRRYTNRFHEEIMAVSDADFQFPELSRHCYVCLKQFVNLTGQVLQIISTSKSVQSVLVECDLLPDLLHKAIFSELSFDRDRSRSILTALCGTSLECEKRFHEILEHLLSLFMNDLYLKTLNQTLKNLVTTLLSVCSIDSCLQDRWAMQIESVLRFFEIGVSKGFDNSVVCEQVLVPCLGFLINVFSRIEMQTNLTVAPPKLPRKYQLISGSPSSVSARTHLNSVYRKSRKSISTSSDPAPSVSIKSCLDSLILSSFSPESRKMRTFLLRYRAKWVRSSTLYLFADPRWIRKLILTPASLDVRVKVAELIRILCERSEDARSALIPALLNVIVSTHLASSSVMLFDLLEDLAHRPDCKVLMSGSQCLTIFIGLMSREVRFLRCGKMESSYPLFGVISLLHHFSESTADVRDCLKSRISSLVEAFLFLQEFHFFRSKQTQDASRMLFQIIDDIFSESDSDRMALISAYIEALGRNPLDIRKSIHILEQIDAVIHPKRNSEHCQLLLRKAPSQEEFIRGNMKKTPYSSVDLVTMEDLKNKICRDLDLEDAAGMFELLVNGCIIDLSLPIAGVFQKIWKPALLSGATSVIDYDSDYDDLVIDASSMVVTYRLKGLDGEATEDIVSHLSDDDNHIEPELKYAPLSIFGESGGIAQILRQLQGLENPFGDNDLETQYCALAIRTFRYCAYIDRNLAHLTRGYHFLLSLLLNLLKNTGTNQYKDQMSNDLLDILASIVDENVADAVEDVRKIVDFLLSYSPLPVVWPRLASLLPGITRGLSKPVQVLLESFMIHLDWQQIDSKSKLAFPAECFAFVSESLSHSSSESASELRLMASKTIVPAALDYLKSIEFNSSASLSESLPYVLRILTGLVKGFPHSQLAAVPIISLLHRLERITSTNKVGPLAENLLDALCDGCSEVASIVQKLRDETRSSRKQVALAKRRKLLDQLGLQPSGKSSISISGIESVVSDPGLTCMVCREGYAYKPRDMLGFYVFDKEINLSMNPSKDENVGLTSVTHFNTIHFNCHSDAAGADRRKKPPKSEWEGATLRNARTLCNNIFPILHKSNSLDEYALRIDDYWRNISFRSAFQFQKLELLIHNLRLLLSRFAQDRSFSEFSKGGGRQSNIRFIPYLIQMGAFLLNSSSGEVTGRLRKAVINSVHESEEQWLSLAFSDGTAAYSHDYAMEYFLVGSLFVLKPEEWLRERTNFLRRLIIFSRKTQSSKYVHSPPLKKRKTDASSSSNSSAQYDINFGSDSVLESVKPVLLFFFLVNNIHQCLVKFEAEISGNENLNAWDRILRYTRHHHQDMLVKLDEICQGLSNEISLQTDLNALLNMCIPEICSNQQGNILIQSLWSLADDCCN